MEHAPVREQVLTQTHVSDLMMRIIFFGSDDFAAVHLESLLASGHEVLACVTGPDKPQGRGMKLVASPIKEKALERSIPCLQPVSLKTKDIVDV